MKGKRVLLEFYCIEPECTRKTRVCVDRGAVCEYLKGVAVWRDEE